MSKGFPFNQTSMISKSKGKTEISLNLAKVFRWRQDSPFLPFDLFNLFLWVRTIWRPDIHLPYQDNSPSQKIEFGPTRQPPNTKNGVQPDSRSLIDGEAWREDLRVKGSCYLSD